MSVTMPERKRTAMLEKADEIKALLAQKDKELHECQACIQTILTRTLHGVVIVDENWSIVFANPAAERFLDTQEKGLLDRPFEFPLVAGETRELNMLSRGGNTIAVDISMIDIEWAGKPAVFISIQDVSERKRSDLERQKMYQAMMQSPSMVMITDSLGNIENVNPRFTEVTGYQEADVIGRNPRFLQSGQTPAERYLELWGLLSRGEVWRGEFVNRKKNGEFFTEFAAIAPVIDFDGRITHFVAVKEDITVRKHTEEALAISETRYRRLFETTGDGILILDAATGKIIDVTPLLMEMLGYHGENFIGKKLWDFGAFADIEASKASFMALQHDEYIRYEDLPLETKDGRQIYVEFISNVYPVDGKKLIQCNIRDITARKQAQMEISRLNADLAARAAELEAANLELDAFNYSVAHDLRKPLNVINGYCQAIKELSGDRLDEQCREYLQETYNGTLRMNRLIDVLLDFSRMARVELHRETVNLSDMATAVIAELKLAEPRRQDTFRIAAGITADGDANLLRTVLANLLGNAWKYTGVRETAIIEFGAMERNSKPVFFVGDNGTGFDMADAEKMFVPFQLLPGAGECRGFGIGLATVGRIIKRHGGRVWAEGEPGKGATFYFTLSAEGEQS